MEREKTTITAPGLKYRKRADGRLTPLWVAPYDAVRAGFLPKSVNLADCPPELIEARCRRWRAEAMEYRAGQARSTPSYDGTIGSLIQLYQTHPDSKYHKLKPSSRRPYDVYARKLTDSYGERRVASITGLDVLRWHATWRAPLGDGEEPRLGAATMALNVLKSALAWGEITGATDCRDLHATVIKLSLPTPKPRQFAPNAADVIAAREAAHKRGRHSAALCYALQFETTARQQDIIGQWIPLSDQRPSSIIAGGQKWIGPTWSVIGDDGVLAITPSKTERTTGKRVHVDLALCPMVVEELSRVSPEARKGPLIVNERTGLPYGEQAFQNVWKAVRNAAGLSPKLWNRDIRAGGITEGGEAGASADDRAKVAGHSTPRMVRSVYDRQDGLIAASRVAEARVKFRRGNKD